MELLEVGQLIAYIILGLLAADRAWFIFKPTRAEKETNGRLELLQREVADLHREEVRQLLTSIQTIARDNHEDLVTLRTENAKAHLEIVDRVRDIIEKK